MEKSAWRSSFAGPVLVLVIGLGLAAAGGIWLHRHNAIAGQLELEQVTARVSDEVARRFRLPVYWLVGARGLFAASEQVDRDEFRRYVDSRDLANEFPGVRGLGLIQRIGRDEQASFVERERADGAPGFTIRQLEERSHDDLYVIRFIEPQLRNAGAAGLDVGSEPRRREAAQRAADSGAATLTRAVTLVQDERRSPGALLYLPMYAEGAPLSDPGERRAALTGLLYAPIVFAELLHDLRDTLAGQVRFNLLEVGDEATGSAALFDSKLDMVAGGAVVPVPAVQAPRFSATHSVAVPGRTLSLRVDSTPEFDANYSRTAPWGLFAGGALVSVLLSLLLWQQATARRRAEVMAQAMTSDLERLAKVVRHTSNAVFITDSASRIQWINEGFTRVTGYVLAEAQGKTPGELLGSGKADPAVLRVLTEAAAAGVSCRVEVLNRAKDGRQYWVDTEVQPLRDAQGRLTGTMEIATDISGRRAVQAQLEAALRDNHALLATINLHSIVSMADRAGRIVFANDAFCRISGYAREELLGHDHHVLNSGVQPDGFWVDVWQTISGGKTWRGQVCNRAKDGSLYWVDSVIAPILDADGRIDRYISIRSDITASKRLAEDLVNERQRRDDIIQGTNAGTWEWNMASGEVHFNERWAEIIGYTIAELSPLSVRTFFDHVHPDDLGRSRELLEQHVAGASPFFECELRMRHKAGQWVWVLARGRLSTRASDGRPEWIAGTNLDVTERKSAEAQTQAAAQLLRGAIDAIDEAFVLFDAEDRLVFCNEKYRQMYASVAHRMVPGARFEDLIRAGAENGDYSAAIGRVDAWVAERLAAHRAADSVLVQRLENGRTLRIVERRLPDGHTVGFRIDITELVQATEAAQLGSRAKGQFLANMSHEIRTPMNAVVGMLTLLRRTELTRRQADYASKAENAARALLGLIDDILDISKVEAGKLALDVHPFRIDHLLRDLAVILSSTVGDKDVEVLFDLDPALPRQLVGDPLRLQQVLINLGGNAVKFTEHGEVVLALRVLHQDAQQVTLEFAVRDTGIGIAPENQVRIFEGFTQAEASTTRRFGGTGLGVAISQRLVALMGGQLLLESTLGQGSRFHFSITLAQAFDDFVDTLAREPQSRAPWRALLVDDNPTARALLEGMCRSLGWEVDCADGGEAALALLGRRAQAGIAYQAMFVDWQMPGMDGWQTCQRIRAMALADAAPVIVMVTAHGREMLQQRAGQEERLLDGYLVKPVTASMLLDAVLDARALRGAAPAAAPGAPAHPRLSGMRVLVAEDNVNNQQVVLELLRDEGALVQIAVDGQAAVDAVAAAQPAFDAVLMDLQMPGMDGLSATRRIRADLGMGALPIIAMTANAMSSDRVACLAAGMNDHIGKPYNLGDLVRVLRKNAGWPEWTGVLAAEPVRELPADVRALAAAAGVAIDTALQRIGGRIDVYQRMLRLFVDDLLEAPGQLREHVAHGEFAQASNLLHTIKGVAATLGADVLAAAMGAGEAQFAARPSAEPAVAAAQGAGDAIAGAIDGLRGLERALSAAQAHPAPASDTASGPAVRAALLAVSELLHNGDMAATDAVAALQRQAGTVLKESMQAMCDAVERLDFERASRLCDELLEGLAA